jgi:phage regulator Rha-like protein
LFLIVFIIFILSAQRRNLVEKRIEFRLQTIDKFNELHEKSLEKMYEHTLKQNEAARIRNHNLLCQIGAGCHHLISLSSFFF